MGTEYEAKTIHAITSIPCFELWYLLHVCDSRKPYGRCGDLINELKTKSPFKNYQKNSGKDFVSKISTPEHIKKAYKRAERFLQAAKEEGQSEFDENPSTRVHLLVKALIDLSENPEFQNVL